MDSLFLLQFACFIFMFINAFIVALSCLHVRWKNRRYERSRWMIAAAITGLAIQYVIQMKFGFRAIDDDLGAVINILVYTPCFSLTCRESIIWRPPVPTAGRCIWCAVPSIPPSS